MDKDLEKEAPNVVTEAEFRMLVASGFQAEIVCLGETYIKGSVWYGEWIIRVVSSDRTFGKVLSVNVRRGVAEPEQIKFRAFKTINGLCSFFQKVGFEHMDIPFVRGGRTVFSLPPESATKDSTD
ncbi:hypothetical protein [Palleronia sp.]|uniref:hypothetical protein n=1 Tax=Palleronia sp. TaxID=1940284 RepID=UPI0035C8628E